MTFVEMIDIKIEAITTSNQESGCYALYGEGKLLIVDSNFSTIKSEISIPNMQIITNNINNIQMEGNEPQITIYFYHPYVCVTEQFGVSAALVNIETNVVRELRRKDYHSNVSSYSIGFVERNGRILLICQTEWNRLDIFDAETGKNLTEREIYWLDTGKRNSDGSILTDTKNHLDYFHSLLHISPDGKHFLSNGWNWHPYGQVLLFETEEFLRKFELSNVQTKYELTDNWDLPCTFINNDLFIVAKDDVSKARDLPLHIKQEYVYKQLWFFRVSEGAQEDSYGRRWLKPYKEVACDVFTTNEHGHVYGQLYYDSIKKYLVAITPDKGAFSLDMNGKILNFLPNVFSCDIYDYDTYCGRQFGWKYDINHHVFYTWQDNVGILERQFN